MTRVYQEGRLVLSGFLILNDKEEILLLYRKDHHHYETPGGKVRLEECSSPENPTLEDLAKAAKRELYEELGNNIRIQEPKFFGKVELTIPDGRPVVVYKFLTKIIAGEPKINEPEVFRSFDYIPIERLEECPLSPDLKLLLPKLKNYIKATPE